MDEETLEYEAQKLLDNPMPEAKPKNIPSQALPQMSMQDFFGALNQYEQMRQSILSSELMKMQSIEKIITERVNQHIATLGENSGESDPIMQEAGKFLIDVVKNTLETSPPTQQKVIPQITKKEEIKDNQQQEQKIEEPKQEVIDMSTLSDEKINEIADGIYERFPKDVLNFQKGVITREQAIGKIMAYPGMKRDIAERIAQALLDTEYPEV